jgi:hypothetical protein
MRTSVAASDRPQTRAVTYADGITAVLPGDRVSVRLFFRRRAGEVIYVPGISKRRGSYEHNGLTWVGISLPDGWAVGEIVLPETHGLKRSVRFHGRGTESEAGADALSRIDRQEAEEDDAALATEEPVAPPAKSRPLDWLAAIVAIGFRLGTILLFIGLIAGAIMLARKLW